MKGFYIMYRNNIIHRDIKPANVLIHNNIYKIGDFGFARVIDSMVNIIILMTKLIIK